LEASSAVSQPTEVIQHGLQNERGSAIFSRRITSKLAMGAKVVVVDLEICKLSLQGNGIPE
jgi:hypothetical protein